ncbi:hypothetical protein J0H58_17440 [bacterium]|nr:hypothetical protein [bacterium]
MRLPAPSYAVEAVLGAAAVVLAVIVVWPDEPRRPRANAKAAPAQPPAPQPPPRPPTPLVPTRLPTRDELDAEHRAAVKQWTAKVAAQEFPFAIDPVRAADVRAAHLMATLAGTVGAFERTPGRNAAWADLARAALDARARQIVADQLAGDPPAAVTAAARAAASRAVAAGCDDPLIAYWHLRDATDAPDPAAFRAAVARVYASRYPAVRRVHALHNWLVAASRLDPDHELRADEDIWEERFWELFAAAAREHDLSADEELVELAGFVQVFRTGQRRPRQQVLDEFDDCLRRAGARDYLRLTIRGAGCIKLAWDARGSGYAHTVTAEGWRVFDARLREARQALAAATADDPDGYSAPTHMLTVCMGMSLDRDTVEDAFQRAMTANPDNQTACWTKLEILHPKWQGSPDGADYRTFAWALALHPGDGRYAAAVLRHVTANTPVAGPAFDAARGAVAAYYLDPQVWELVRAAADRALAGNPGDRYTLNVAAKIAVLARRHAVASEYFARIKDDFSPLVFANRHEYGEYYRESGAPANRP